MNVYPLKKRRGRPPKYLHVWRDHFLSSQTDIEMEEVCLIKQGAMEDEDNNNNQDIISKVSPGAEIFPTDIAEHDVKPISPTRKHYDEEDPQPGREHYDITEAPAIKTRYDDTGTTNTTEHYDGIEASSKVKSEVQISTILHCSVPEPPILSPQSPVKELCPVNSDDRNQPSPSLQGDIHAHCTAAMREMPPPLSPVSPTRKHYDEAGPLAAMEHYDATTNQTACLSQTVLSNHQPSPHGNTQHVNQKINVNMTQASVPVKRRPGRPPGSTKKVKAAYNAYDKVAAPEEDFSLRKFFEAGGRDYNEYLEWLKQGRQSAAMSQVAPPGMFPPFFPVALPGGRMMVPPHGVPGSFQFQAPQYPVGIAPQSPMVAMTPPPMYRQPIRMISGGIPRAPSTDSIENKGNLYSNGITKVEPIAGHMEKEHGSVEQSVSPRSFGSGSPVSPESCVLDLSYRKRKDSEKENIIQDIAHKKFRYKDSEMRCSQSDPSKTKESTSNLMSEQEVGSSTGLDLSSWDVDQVAEFIGSLSECHVYVPTFRNHRIDGATLPHLSDDHLLNHMGMKLGHMIRMQLALDKLRGPIK